MTLMILDFLFLLFQGFNRLVAIALLFMAEEDAFWCLVYIIESLMPPEYYSRDKQLIGAQVDQVSKSTVFENPAKKSHFNIASEASYVYILRGQKVH